MKPPNPYTQRKLNEARHLPPHDEPFAGINISFHKTYTRLVEQVLAQLGESVPVVVLTGDNATLFFDSGEQWFALARTPSPGRRGERSPDLNSRQFVSIRGCDGIRSSTAFERRTPRTAAAHA